jgi:hypothetical protein
MLISFVHAVAYIAILSVAITQIGTQFLWPISWVFFIPYSKSDLAVILFWIWLNETCNIQ